jgi:uncharacterized protein (DUF1501 family)
MKPVLKTRREFLGNCALASLGVAMPQFLIHTTQAIGRTSGWEAGSAAPISGFRDGRVLVVVQLSGGNDGLNTVIPYADDAYHRARPSLAVEAASRINLDDTAAFHTALKPLMRLRERGELCVVEGVGYPNPNRSHFRSMEIWHTASDADRYARDGWIGRYFDNCCSGTPDPAAGIFLGPELPQAFDGRGGTGIAFQTPESFGYLEGESVSSAAGFRRINSVAGGENPSLDFLRAVTGNANMSADRVHAIARRVRNAESYPVDAFSRGLATIAQMIAGDLGTRIYYIPLGGFDTHAGQAGSHQRLLATFAQGMDAFYRDLEKLGLADRVVTLAFSEFGRRVEENASKGTDHGAAGPMFLLGPAVRGGFAGKRPDLTRLDANGDLAFTTDFRSVYATVLEGWLEVDSSVVLPREFPLLDVIRT